MGDFRLSLLELLRYRGNELLQGGTRGVQPDAAEIRVHRGRDDFHDLDFRAGQKRPQRAREGVHGGFCGAIDGSARQRNEGQTRGHIEDERVWRLLEGLQEKHGEMEGSFPVDGNLLLCSSPEVCLVQTHALLDARVVHEDVQPGMLG